jgi:hypothetical protein
VKKLPQNLGTGFAFASPGRVFFTSWLLLSLLSVLWSLATPIAASPDEPAHAVKAAAVVRGEFLGAQSNFGNYATVPKYVAWTNSQACYARNPDQSASCITDVSGDPFTTVTTTTTAGQYNPLYYILVGWPSLIFHDSSGIFAMRIVSGILSSALLALGVMMISTWRRRAIPFAAFTVALTPMTFFLSGSINPNSLEIAGTLTAFIGMLSIVLHPDPTRLTSRATIVMVAAGLAVNSRGLSALWLAVALFVPLLLTTRAQLLALVKTRIARLTIAVVGVSTALALVWIKLADLLKMRSPDAGTTPSPVYPMTGASPLHGFVTMLAQTLPQLDGMIGVFGWLDTPAPKEIFVLWTVLIGSLVLASLVVLRGKPAITAITLGAAFIFIPALVQAAYITSGGFIWQGRYTLPLLVIFVVGLGALLSPCISDNSVRPRRLILVILALWGIAQLVSFGWVLRRYVVGINGGRLEFLTDPKWQPPGGTVLLLVLFGLTIVVTVVVSVLWVAPRVSDELTVTEPSPATP